MATARNRIFPCLLALGFGLSAAQAAAQPVVGRIDGVIESGIDLSGVFGAADTDLAGALFTLRFAFDTDSAPVGAGGLFEADGDWLSLSITIDGASFALGGGGPLVASSAIELVDGGVDDSIGLTFGADGAGLQRSLALALFGGDFLGGVDTLPTNLDAAGDGIGAFAIGDDGAEASGFLLFERILFAPAGVPAPAAVLLFGLGMVALGIRRRA